MFVTSLPRLPSDIDVILVCKEGASEAHKDFSVRRSKILMALEQLKQNNKYYRNINLDESALTQLLKDGNQNGLSTIVMSLDDDDHINDSAPLDDDTFMSGTFVPMVPRKETEQNVIRQSISSRQYVWFPPLPLFYSERSIINMGKICMA